MGATRGRPVLPVLVVGRGAAAAEAYDHLSAGGLLASRTESDALTEALTSRVWSAVVTGWTVDGVDAVAVCKEVRATPSVAGVPVLALISRSDDEAADEAISAGADDFVVMPCDPDELLTRVQAAVRPVHASGPATRLASLVANIPGAVYRCMPDESWTMWYISDRISELTGYPASDFIANATRTFVSVIHPDDRARVESTVAAALHRDRPYEVSYRIVTADDEIRYVTDYGRLVHDGRNRWLDGIILDVTGHHIAEQRLREQLVRQTALDERLRVAHDLHDSVSQTLYSMVTHARAAELVLANQPAPDSAVRSRVGLVRTMAQEALEDVRSTVVSLRPQPEDRDLAAAIQRHVDEITARHDTEVIVSSPAELPSLDPAIVFGLSLISREAVQNAVKHAASDVIRVNVAMDSDRQVSVEVSDDGGGFDPTRAAPGHFGLATMRERAESLGGRLEISSRPDTGTVVRATIPAQAGRAGDEHGG